MLASMRARVAGLAAVAICATALAAGSVAASPAASTVPISGVILLKPIATKHCRAVTGKLKGEEVTQVQCSDPGVMRGLPRLGGASNGWLWTRHPSGRTDELANFSVNFGNGIALLTLTGSMQPVGKVTPQAGHAITTGTWKTRPGTGVYKALTGTGTYTFEVKRTATRYTILKLTLRGNLH
jgi:hypothetical protein